MGALIPASSFALCIVASFLLKETSGSSYARPNLDFGLSTVVAPVNDMTRQLKDILQEVELKKREIENHKVIFTAELASVPKKCLNEDVLQHATLLQKWNFDSCVNVTDDCNEASHIVYSGGLYVINVTQALFSLGNNLLNCSSWFPLDTLKCYADDLKNIKELLVGFKNQTQPLVDKGMATLRKLRVDFDHCIGIPVTSKREVDKHLENC